MTDLERLDDNALSEFADRLVLSWSPRDEMIARTARIRAQNWTVQVPPAVKTTLKTQHSSVPFDIATRVIGLLTARDPVFLRVPPDEDERVAERANTVERYCQARFEWDKDNALAGRDSWTFLTDQIANKGAGCVGNIFRPHAYADAPPLRDEDGEYIDKWWRDGSGKKTDKKSDMDLVASSRAYVKAVDRHRMSTDPPMEHRFVPTEQSYPCHVGRTMMATVIRRKASILELSASGFDTTYYGKGDTDATVEKTFELTEVWTPNRCRYFIEKRPVPHKVYGSDGITTAYGAVPFDYRVGLPGTEEVEFGPAGLPLLALVESNIIMIDSLLTFRYNAIHGFSFPSWQVIREIADDTLSSLASDSEPKTYKIEPGMAVDFKAPGVRLEPLMHPGMNKDFDKAIEDERAEIRKIIPDVLFGIPASSGYNSSVMTQQARAFFNPMIGAQQHQAKQLAVMDLHHIERLGGPTYIDYAERENGTARAVSRIKIDAKAVDGYYGLHAEIGKELDRVTMGTWAAGMVEKGLMARETAAEICGVTDWQHEEAMMARDRFMQKPEVQAVVEAKAIKTFGLEQEQQEVAARGMIDPATGLVTMPDGSLAGPGMGAEQQMMGSPQGQAMNGAIMGGANMNSAGPNMASAFNPSIGQPTPQQPNRMRRRGGAIPGAPQDQGGEKRVRFGP